MDTLRELASASPHGETSTEDLALASGDMMEYPPSDDKKWQVIAYDLHDKPMIMQQGLREKECKRIAKMLADRADVSRVAAKELD